MVLDVENLKRRAMIRHIPTDARLEQQMRPLIKVTNYHTKCQNNVQQDFDAPELAW